MNKTEGIKILQKIAWEATQKWAKENYPSETQKKGKTPKLSAKAQRIKDYLEDNTMEFSEELVGLVELLLDEKLGIMNQDEDIHDDLPSFVCLVPTEDGEYNNDHDYPVGQVAMSTSCGFESMLKSGGYKGNKLTRSKNCVRPATRVEINKFIKDNYDDIRDVSEIRIALDVASQYTKQTTEDEEESDVSGESRNDEVMRDIDLN